MRGKEGISGRWAVRRERGQPGWLTVGPRGWLVLAVTGNTEPPRRPSLGQQEGAGSAPAQALPLPSVTRGHAGTLGERPVVTGPRSVRRVHLPGAEGGACTVVPRPEVPGCRDSRGHKCWPPPAPSKAVVHCAATEYLTRPNKSACIINQAGSEEPSNLSS